MTQATDLTLPCLVHDLNNVFQTLVEAADLLAGDPQWAPVSAAILRSIERGKGITDSMQQVEQAPAPFETILQNAIAFAEDSLISGRGPAIRFVSQVEPGIELRRTWAWERVLINLFSNAMRAMPDGGTIFISARIVGGCAEIVVRDEGAGIARRWSRRPLPSPRLHQNARRPGPAYRRNHRAAGRRRSAGFQSPRRPRRGVPHHPARRKADHPPGACLTLFIE